MPSLLEPPFVLQSPEMATCTPPRRQRSTKWQFDQPCPLPLRQREQIKMGPPPGQTSDCALVSFVHTSTAHAYPVTQFKGTWADCEQRRVETDYPQKMRTHQAECMPVAY